MLHGTNFAKSKPTQSAETRRKNRGKAPKRSKACLEDASTLITQREKKNMPDSYSCQTSLSTPDQSGEKNDRFTRLEDESTVSEPAFSETKFRSVMSQYEMEILTTLFPKCTQTLANVLRNRPLRLEEEL
jgi:hypothetical protein